jgi:hypothetical protein
MKQVLVKIHLTNHNAAMYGVMEKIVVLREWCHEHIKKGFRSYPIGLADKTTYFTVFEFDCEKEAMLFQLYVGEPL